MASPLASVTAMAVRWMGTALARVLSGSGYGRQARSNRAARVLVDRLDRVSDLWTGAGTDWADRRHGEYYATSTAIHAAVKVRSEAVGRPPLRVRLVHGSGEVEPAGPDHPLQALLDRPNAFWSPGELWRATETYLSLWGSAYWGIERDESGRPSELWPLRPDRMRVLPDEDRYIRGYVFDVAGKRVAYLPEEVVWFRHFNPLEEFAGLSPVAPARAAVDMASSALLFNRAFFSNSATPGDLAITTEETPTDDEVEEFYARWESRFTGGSRAHRPILLSRGMDAKRLGLSHRDMEFIEGLKWSVEEVSRAFGVPKALLSELQDATLANIDTEERFLWRNTMVPEMRLLQDAVNRSLAPLFDTPGQPRARAEFDLSAIEALRENEDARVERWARLVEAGVMTVNEVRAERGLEPVEWGDRPR